MSDIEQFAQQVKDKLGLERFEVVIDRRGNIVLDNIEVPRNARGKGAGAAALKELTDYADRTGALIWLSVADRDSSTGTTSRGRLVKFYRQFGFVPNKGRNKRFELSLYAHMYRDPKGIQEEINEIRRRAGLPIVMEFDIS
jgi:GNAT superfamily N-acetyltransferase